MTVKAIPTGHIIVKEYDRGPLETLSIGDYGKAKNVKASFLGYTNPINGVPGGPTMPLSEKWVVTLSTQYGCPMRCTFCDVPKVGYHGNASFDDLKGQLFSALLLNPGVSYTERLNIHFARMGEPTFNADVLRFAEWLGGAGRIVLRDVMGLRVEVIHPVVSTMCPADNSRLPTFLIQWAEIKNQVFNGQAGLQLSINTTDDLLRQEMFSCMAMSVSDISKMSKSWPNPLGRKYCLNFAYTKDFPVDAKLLAKLFSPSRFMVKITPMHHTAACADAGIETAGGYESYAPYEAVERSLIDEGFDVLVFVPSWDEERGLVTCGNAVLAEESARHDT